MIFFRRILYTYVYVCIYTEQVRGSVEGVVEETATTITGGASVEKGDSGAYEGVRTSRS